MKNLTTLGLAVLLALVATSGMPAKSARAAALGYSGGTLTENFDTLPTNVSNPVQLGLSKAPFFINPAINNLSGLTGWQSANIGSSATSEFRSQDGSLSGSGGRGVISYGINGSSERALGALPTSNQINPFGLVLVNNSQDTYQKITVSFVGEQWRRGEPGVNNIMTFAYGEAADIAGGLTAVPALSFSNPNSQAAPTQVALDGNLPANQVALWGTISGLQWAPGETLVLRWTTSEGSGQDNGMAIDNFEFSAQVPEPSTLALAIVAAIGLALRHTRRIRATSF
jgi:hypothetical protein